MAIPSTDIDHFFTLYREPIFVQVSRDGRNLEIDARGCLGMGIPQHFCECYQLGHIFGMLAKVRFITAIIDRRQCVFLQDEIAIDDERIGCVR